MRIGQMTRRDEGVESLRVLLAFGIVLLHSITMCGHNNKWIAQPLFACVDAFVFISGYYGIKFKLSKLLRLYSTGLLCCFIAVAIDTIFGAGWPGAKEFWKTFIERQWFLHAYAVMMMLAPLIDNNRSFKNCWTVLALVFVWGGLASVPYFGRLLPRTSGVEAYSGLTLFGIYAAARLFRHYRFETRVKPMAAILLLPALYVLSVAGCGACCSPVALGISVIMFVYGRKINLGTIGRYLAPSTFSIFLLHANPHGFAFMRMAENGLIERGWPVVCTYLPVAVCTFAACAILDIPRRLFCLLFDARLGPMMARCDEMATAFVSKIELYLPTPPPNTHIVASGK